MWYIFNLVLYIERVHLSFSELTDFSEVTRLKYRSEGQTELSNFPSHSPSRANMKVSHPFCHAGILLLFSTFKRVQPIFTAAHLIPTYSLCLHVSLTFQCGVQKMSCCFSLTIFYLFLIKSKLYFSFTYCILKRKPHSIPN